MKVKELIEKLQALDPEWPVVTKDRIYGGMDFDTDVRVVQVDEHDLYWAEPQDMEVGDRVVLIE